MKLLFPLLIVTSLSAYAADEECVFDTERQKDFITQYIASHADSSISDDGMTIKITRENELISFRRGGCVHFGIFLDITLKGRKFITEKAFFSRVQNYNEEFGTELVNTKELANALHNKDSKKEITPGGISYFVAIPSVASYEIAFKSRNDDTNIYIGFYIN